MALKINIKLIKLVGDMNRFNHNTYHHKESNYNNTQLKKIITFHKRPKSEQQ